MNPRSHSELAAGHRPARRIAEMNVRACGSDAIGAHSYNIVIASSYRKEREDWVAHLSHPDYRLHVVENGTLALQAIFADRVDLVVAAVSMDALDGLELLRALSTLPKRPAVILIAQGDGEVDRVYVKMAKLFGAAEAYTQPLSPEALRQGVYKALGLVAV